MIEKTRKFAGTGTVSEVSSYSEPLPENPSPKHRNIIDIKEKQCRFWVYGEKEFTYFCGLPTEGKSRYCKTHIKRVLEEKANENSL